MQMFAGIAMFTIGCLASMGFAAMGEQKGMAIAGCVGVAVSMAIGFIGILISGLGGM